MEQTRKEMMMMNEESSTSNPKSNNAVHPVQAFDDSSFRLDPRQFRHLSEYEAPFDKGLLVPS